MSYSRKMIDKKKSECEVCGEHGVEPRIDRFLSTYKGVEDFVEQVHHVCSCCGADFANADDARINKRNMIRFRKGVDMIPLGCEIRSMRIRANLTVRHAGEIFGGGPVAFSKYENDDLIPDDAMVGLIKLAIEDPLVVERLASLRTRHVTIKLDGGSYSSSTKLAVNTWSASVVESSPVSVAVSYDSEFICQIH